MNKPENNRAGQEAFRQRKKASGQKELRLFVPIELHPRIKKYIQRMINKSSQIHQQQSGQ
jgi:hypothetical protein